MFVLDVDLVRLDEELPLPQRAHPTDAGVDLLAREDAVLAPGRRTLMGTGVAIALPEGYAAFVHPRSGLAAREGLGLLNAPGTVDAGYRGEIRVCLVNHDPERPVVVRRGDRIAQLVVQRVEIPRFRVRADLSDVAGFTAAAPSTRGGDGFGSTGVATTGYTGPEEDRDGGDRTASRTESRTESRTDDEEPARRAGGGPGEVAW